MFKPSLYAATAVTLLSVAAIGVAADDKPVHVMEHHDVAIVHQVEVAQTQADHEAIAQRFEKEAAELDKKAAEHERLAVQYHKAPSNPKWNNNATALAAHCERYAANLKSAAAEAREMAQLHHDVAKLLAADAGK